MARSDQHESFGSIDMTRAILPHFREKRSGKIAFVGSYGGWYGAVGVAPYCTAKFALEGLFSCYQSLTRGPHMLTAWTSG